MNSFQKDLEIFHKIAIEAHDRINKSSTNPYVKSQSIVENYAHKRIAELNASSRKVLEIGIGGGEHLAFENFDEKEVYIGLDREADFINICREKFGVEVHQGDAAALPFKDGTFDAVLACSVLEHVERLDQTLSEIKRVLEPGGRLLVMIPANGGLAVNLYKLLVTYPYMRYRGIKRPGAVWHYLNVNGLQRIEASLRKHFLIEVFESSPIKFVPWYLSPMYIFICHA